MARDKCRSRERGPINETTRQPTTGQKNFGGQKNGEMENWNLYCYGMPEMFRDMNHDNADKFRMFICTKCNTQCMGCIDIGFYFCNMCKTGDHVARLPNTYATNLAFKELYAAGFGHSIITEPESDPTIDEDKLYHDFKKLQFRE